MSQHGRWIAGVGVAFSEPDAAVDWAFFFSAARAAMRAATLLPELASGAAYTSNKMILKSHEISSSVNTISDGAGTHKSVTTNASLTPRRAEQSTDTST